MGGEHLKIQPSVDHHHHRSAGHKAALIVNVGVAQVIVVTGRAAEMGDAAERGAEGVKNQLFAAGQAVEQRQGKGVILDRRQVDLPTVTKHPLYRLLRFDQAEAVQCADQRAVHGKGTQVQPNRADAATTITFGADFASGGAAQQHDAAKVLIQRGRQLVERIFRRAEEQHAAQMRVQ